jgi:hypothetical protein
MTIGLWKVLSSIQDLTNVGAGGEFVRSSPEKRVVDV